MKRKYNTCPLNTPDGYIPVLSWAFVTRAVALVCSWMPESGFPWLPCPWISYVILLLVKHEISNELLMALEDLRLPCWSIACLKCQWTSRKFIHLNEPIVNYPRPTPFLTSSLSDSTYYSHPSAQFSKNDQMGPPKGAAWNNWDHRGDLLRTWLQFSLQGCIHFNSLLLLQAKFSFFPPQCLSCNNSFLLKSK